MGIFNTALTLNVLKRRLYDLTELNLIKQDDDIRKIINGKREPGIGLFVDLIKKLGYSTEALDDSKLVYFRMNHVILIEQIELSLKHKNICDAEKLLKKLENEMVKVPLTEQEFLL